MLTVTAFEAGSSATIAPDDIPAALAGEALLVWIDGLDVSDAELRRLEGHFDLHPLAVEDAREQGQRTKIERYPTHAFIVLYGADDDPAGGLPEVHLFAGEGWVITLRFSTPSGRAVDLGPAADRFLLTRADEAPTGYFVHAILDLVVDGYFDVVDHLDDALQAIEDELYATLEGDHPSADRHRAALQPRLLAHRRQLVVLRRQVVPLREVLFALARREHEWIDEEASLYLQDVLDHLLRLVDQLNAQRELVSNAFDAYMASVSNRANEIMKKMTSWGAILLGSTLIAGIYGMNFRYMPELDERWGYPASLAGMVVLTLVLYVYFRRKRWL